MTQLEIGDVDRVAFVFLDEAETLETPTALTITIRHPGYPTTTDTTVTQASGLVTLGKTFPLSVREALARRLSTYNITAANLAAGTGCVEYLHTITQAGGAYKYSCVATAPSAAAVQAESYVHVTF